MTGRRYPDDMRRRSDDQSEAEGRSAHIAKDLGLPNFWRLARRPVGPVRPGFQILRTLWKGERRV